MLMKSPYNTTYGKLLNVSTTIKALITFIASTRSIGLNYEINTKSNVNIVFITGYNAEEAELPMWEHPLVFKDHRDRDTVAIDLRKYLKVVNGTQPLTIDSVAKDKSYVNFMVLRGLITCDFIAGNYGNFRNYYKNIISGYALVLSTYVNALVTLNPVEKVQVEIAIAFYVNLLFSDSIDYKEMLPVITARIQNSKLSIPLNNNKLIETTVEKLIFDDYTIDSLVKNIAVVLPAEKSPMITTNALINIMTNMWFGPGGTETVVMSLEHMPTWIALEYINIADDMFKRGRLAMLFDKYKSQIKPTDFVKGIDLYIKEHKL